VIADTPSTRRLPQGCAGKEGVKLCQDAAQRFSRFQDHDRSGREGTWLYSRLQLPDDEGRICRDARAAKRDMGGDPYHPNQGRKIVALASAGQLGMLQQLGFIPAPEARPRVTRS